MSRKNLQFFKMAIRATIIGAIGIITFFAAQAQEVKSYDAPPEVIFTTNTAEFGAQASQEQNKKKLFINYTTHSLEKSAKNQQPLITAILI